MSNYITIESGYYEPFKENETNPELKIWADKYFEIIKKIHEVLSPYNNRFELRDRINKLREEITCFRSKNRNLLSCKDKENQTRELLLQSSFKDEMNSLFEDNEIGFFNSPVYKGVDKKSQDSLWRFNHISDFFSCADKYIKQNFSDIPSLVVSVDDDLSELNEELRKCLTHRVWKSKNSVLIKESNFVSVELDRQKLIFRTCSPWNIGVYSFARGNNTDNYCYEFDENERRNLNIDIDINTFEMTYSIINDIKSKGVSSLSPVFLHYVVGTLINNYSMCSIIETYEDFQSGNIEKVINDKIKCGGFSFYSDFTCRHW